MKYYTAPGGRAELDVGVARRAAALGCTQDEIANLLGVSKTTLKVHMRDDAELRQQIEKGTNEGKTTLRRLQWKKAHEGSDTMLIWLGKQLLNQTDRARIAGDNGGPLVVDFRWADAPIQTAIANGTGPLIEATAEETGEAQDEVVWSTGEPVAR